MNMRMNMRMNMQEQPMRQQPGQPQAAFRIREDGRIVEASEADRLTALAYFTRTMPFHEAAHAVVALALGGSVTLITLDPDEARRASGNPRLCGAVVAPTPTEPEGRALVAVAGIVQDAFFGVPGGPRARGPAAFAASCANAPTDIGEFLNLVPEPAAGDELVERVRRLLEDRQPAVAALGQALAASRRLEGPEILAIVERSVS
jgi:hypothetical protein